ncbi:thioesterase family protein [soil metagenome]
MRHSNDLRLSWGECDPAGIVYFTTYLEWAERVHSEWWLLAGLRLDRLVASQGAAFVVRHASCDYLQPAAAMDRLRCELRVRSVGTTSFATSFAFTGIDTDVEHAVVELIAVFVGRDGRPVAIPDAARAALEGSDRA